MMEACIQYPRGLCACGEQRMRHCQKLVSKSTRELDVACSSGLIGSEGRSCVLLSRRTGKGSRTTSEVLTCS